MTLNGYWTVEGSIRRDASSTLPKGENTYSYPGVNTSLVLSDAFPSIKRGPLTYLKLRGSGPNDITTDLDIPPPFAAVLAQRKADNSQNNGEYKGAKAVVIKGIAQADQMVDVFFDGREFYELAAMTHPNEKTHGSGNFNFGGASTKSNTH